MIDYESYSRIKQYQQEGLKAGQIAQKLNLDPRTVESWLDEPQYRQRKKGEASSKLDSYKEAIVSLIEKHPYTATQIYQRIQEEGYQGGYSLVKQYVRKIRPKRKPAFLTLAFAPGESAQVDWGIYKTIEVGATRRKLNFFVMVLCHSRMLYVEFTLAQSMEHFLACHQHAFEFFGGVPENMMIDNLKTGILQRPMGQAIVFNPKYLDFAHHYGFTIKACGVRKGNEKGRVENAVGYVKKNFLNGLELTQFNALNPAVKSWMDDVANVRIHGETRKKPVDCLAEDLDMMRPVNPNAYDIARIENARSTKLFRVSLDSNRYSVPAEYASQSLLLKIYPQRLCIYHQQKLIARHVRCFDRHQDIEDPDHPKELLKQRRRSQEQKLFQRFIALSPRAGDYYQQMEHKRLNARVHVRKIVGLSEIYGTEAVARAMEDAFAYEAFSSEYIANLLEQQKNILPEASALHLTRSEDLLTLSLEKADVSLYQPKEIKGTCYDSKKS
ncbi:MAG: IS21 family transposase [Methyloprofundus sp.]|nr:IS21 family transposase [Methyloprofundus sp.]